MQPWAPVGRKLKRPLAKGLAKHGLGAGVTREGNCFPSPDLPAPAAGGTLVRVLLTSVTVCLCDWLEPPLQPGGLQLTRVCGPLLLDPGEDLLPCQLPTVGQLL